MDNQAESKRRFWKRRCGHIGGEVVTRRLGRGKARMLLQYEQSLRAEPSDHPAVLQTVIGDLLGARCSICGARDHWDAAESALQELLKRRADRLKFATGVL